MHRRSLVGIASQLAGAALIVATTVPALADPAITDNDFAISCALPQPHPRVDSMVAHQNSASSIRTDIMVQKAAKEIRRDNKKLSLEGYDAYVAANAVLRITLEGGQGTLTRDGNSVPIRLDQARLSGHPTASPSASGRGMSKWDKKKRREYRYAYRLSEAGAGGKAYIFNRIPYILEQKTPVAGETGKYMSKLYTCRFDPPAEGDQSR